MLSFSSFHTLRCQEVFPTCAVASAAAAAIRQFLRARMLFEVYAVVQEANQKFKDKASSIKAREGAVSSPIPRVDTKGRNACFCQSGFTVVALPPDPVQFRVHIDTGLLRYFYSI